VLLTAALVGGLLALINGPWLRVQQVAWAGERYTGERLIERAVSALRGKAILTVDASGLAGRLAQLPAVASARVEAVLPGAVRIQIVEKSPTFVWQTTVVRLLGVADGTLIGQVALGPDLPAELAALPLVEDQRAGSRNLTVGDQIDAPTLAAALRLSSVAPAALGSTSAGLGLRLTDDDGFLLVSASPGWQADFGFYPALDTGEVGTLDEQVGAQVAAVRTLFSVQPEGGVSWVDARDPGRVYWRP
jgi:cell division septal protein FtsQ